MKEFQELLDLFPYCLLVLLPVFIAIAPTPIEAAHEFNVHRMTHLDLYSNTIGAKIASLSMEARPLSASHVLRKVVVAKIKDVSVSRYNDLQSSGCGSLLLLVPQLGKEGSALTAAERENVHVLEEHLRTAQETELPVFYAYETQELNELLEMLESDGGSEGAKKSATQTLLDNIISNGFQLVNAAPAPKPQVDQGVMSLASVLNGAGESDTLPTVLVVAHTDAAAAAPGMAVGADSNASGVGMLMELARMWGALYRSSKTQPKYNVAFLLSGGGKINYYGTKKFNEELKDASSTSANSVASFLHTENLQFVMCLDSLGLGDSINMHVSKPPKAEMPAARFYNDLKNIAGKGMTVDMVHKKINLANTVLTWEHEHFSVNKHSAFTLSRFDNPAINERNSLLDREADPKAMARNTRVIAEAMACTMYGLTGDRCNGEIFDGIASAGLPEALEAWSESLTSSPRGSPLMATPVPKDNARNKPLTKKAQMKLHPVLRTLSAALHAYTGEEVRQMVAPLDREPDYRFYDQQEPIVTNSYRVKPAVFDLVLTIGIAAYLGLVYLGMQNVHVLMALLASFVPVASAAVQTSPKSSPAHKSNGNGVHHNGARLKAQ